MVTGQDQCGWTKHKRERGFTHAMSVTRLSSLCHCLTSTKFGSTGAMQLIARVVARSSTPTTGSTNTRGLCVATLVEEDFF